MTLIRCLHDAKAICGETPVWSIQEQALHWSDIPGSTFHRYELATGARRSWRAEEEICSFAGYSGGGFVAALARGFALVDPASGRTRHLGGSRLADPELRFNDGRCDRSGRFFFAGTMHLPRTRRAGTLYRLDSDGVQTAIAGDVLVSNGLAFSLDNRLMYWSCSRSRMIWKFDFDPSTGDISNRRIFATPSEAQGRPDGAAVDAQGFYWSACFGGGRVIRWSPDGRVDREIEMPVTNCTMCAFGGSELKPLFVTSARDMLSAEQLGAEPLAGALFALDPDISGLPEAVFALRHETPFS